MRPEQLKLLRKRRGEIGELATRLANANDKNLSAIDAAYKQTATVERELLDKRDENMNLINESEIEGVKFLQAFGQCTAETESVNQQINSIQLVIAMLKQQVAVAALEDEQINTVSRAEEELLKRRDEFAKENEKAAANDIKEQTNYLKENSNYLQSLATEQLKRQHDDLSAKHQAVLQKLEGKSSALERERHQLNRERDDLKTSVLDQERALEDKRLKHDKLQQEIGQLSRKVGVMEDNLEEIVSDNVEQFKHYSGLTKDRNAVIDQLRTDLGRARK